MKARLRLSALCVDDRAQPRAALLPDRVAEYVEDMWRGDTFPPMVVFRDKDDVHWLADGFHRYHAAVGLKLESIECDVRRGELRDAILYSCGANAAHGLRRTNADKRQSVMRLLKDDEWVKWSDREIAKQCRVGPHLVGQLREQLTAHLCESTDKPRTVSRGGKTYVQKTGNVGKTKPAKPRYAEDPPERYEDLPLQIRRDNENTFIYSAIDEIERQLAKLPPPAEAAARFPTSLQYVYTTAKLRVMADWLGAFADAWAELDYDAKQHGEDNGKARSTAA